MCPHTSQLNVLMPASISIGARNNSIKYALHSGEDLRQASFRNCVTLPGATSQGVQGGRRQVFPLRLRQHLQIQLLCHVGTHLRASGPGVLDRVHFHREVIQRHIGSGW